MVVESFAPRPGDVIVAPGNWLVRLCQTAPGEGATRAGHVRGQLTPELVIEAVARVRIIEFSRQGAPYEVWRTELNAPKQEAFRTAVLEMNTAWYGAGRIAAHLADWALAWGRWALTLGKKAGEVRLVRGLLRGGARPICSQLVARGLEAAGVDLPGRPWELTPDDLLDWFEASPAWSLVCRRPA